MVLLELRCSVHFHLEQAPPDEHFCLRPFPEGIRTCSTNSLARKGLTFVPFVSVVEFVTVLDKPKACTVC